MVGCAVDSKGPGEHVASDQTVILLMPQTSPQARLPTILPTLHPLPPQGVELLLPTDIVIADKFDPNANTQTVSVDKIPDGWMVRACCCGKAPAAANAAPMPAIAAKCRRCRQMPPNRCLSMTVFIVGWPLTCS